ncbi:MAG: DUF882 domain-containing protein [Hyphomicrobium sp.]|nr:DUF882 domain-containing protein [Hyphomicrobium sp.]
MAFGRSKIVVGILAVASCLAMTSDRITAAAVKGERTISFYHMHTRERLTVTYKKDGEYIPEALKKIDWIMRDWRKNKAIKIDPETIDLAWEMHEELGSREPISIICGFRSASTNEMLRRTRGGQASQSQHITGKAIDITFPDVTLKRMRYSALIRERGGVGYYPTSGIPFVHIDTGVSGMAALAALRVGTLFPDAHTKHMPATGGPITPSDVRVARSKHHDLAVQVAAFHDIRNGVKAPTLVASASRTPDEPEAKPTASAPPSKAAEAPRAPRFAVASLGGGAATATAGAPRKFDLKWEPDAKAAAQRPTVTPPIAGRQLASLTESTPALPASSLTAPKLVNTPKLIERPSRFTPSQADRGKLKNLFEQAAALPEPRLVREPAPAQRPQKQLAAVAAAVAAGNNAPLPRYASLQLASLTPEAMSASITDMSPDELGNGWVQAPEFDEDHPDELAYRPFPLAPLLTETESANDPKLKGDLQHPDVAATLEALDDVGAIAPMKFRPGQQVAQVMWAQQFQGNAVHLDALKEIENSRLPAGLENRTVRTTSR